MINKIAIMGCGSMGLIIGAYLTAAGLDVTMVDAWKENVDALNENGATVIFGKESPTETMNVPVKACIPEDMQGTFDLFIYQTKQTFNETAIPQMKAHCNDRTIICTGQNGLPELTLAEYFPIDRIMGCPIAWPATLMEPGVSALMVEPGNTSFSMHLGKMDGKADEELMEVRGILENICPGAVFLTKNLMADRWSKVLMNATFSAMSTVMNTTFRDATLDDLGAKYIVRIGREVVQTCSATGIRLPEMVGTDFGVLYDFTDQKGEQAAIDTIQKRFADVGGEASMLQDLRKGRKCEIFAINGVVSATARKHGVSTPYCDAAVRIITDVEEGRLPLQNNIALMPL